MKGRLYVGAQGVLIVALVMAPRWSDSWSVPVAVSAVGWAVAAIGAVVLVGALVHLGRALTPWPEPRADGQLTTSGFYRWVRHPIYSGVLAMAWGWTVGQLSSLTIVLAVLLTALLTAKARYEEGLLGAHYPDYGEYARRTPRFVPRPWSMGDSS